MFLENVPAGCFTGIEKFIQKFLKAKSLVIILTLKYATWNKVYTIWIMKIMTEAK